MNAVGFEPTACRLKVGSSTAELCVHVYFIEVNDGNVCSP